MGACGSMAAGPSNFNDDGDFAGKGIGSSSFSGFGRSRSGDLRIQRPPPVTRLPRDVCGVVDAHIKWNGSCRLHIGPKGVVWKGNHVLAQDVVVDQNRTGVRLRFTLFCPNVTSEWVRGVIGLTESFDITLNRREKTFQGVFQRQGEGPLEVELVKAKVYPEDNGSVWNEAYRLLHRGPPNDDSAAPEQTDEPAEPPGVVHLERSNESACPVCFRAWEESGVIRAKTACDHSFCAQCIVTVCAVTPPVTVGACPMCRAEVTLASITMMGLPTV
jgi:hypothetical protein